MKMLINGAWEDSCTGETFEVQNPANGAVIGTVANGTREDLKRAVDAGKEAFLRWSATSPRDRGKCLYAGAQEVRRRAGELAPLLTSEQGKPLREATDEIRGFANIVEYYAGLSSAMHGDFIPVASYGYGIVTQKPLGVCGAIIPWNMPAMIMGWKVGPALLAGNTFVLKPASSAPLTSLTLAGILNDSGLPGGVLNVVTGPGETVGNEMAAHPDIRKISFTGDTVTVRQVMEAAAPSLKRVTLELGGSDPMIVCDDADLSGAVEGALRGRFYNCGQTCTAVKRLYVFESVADAFIRHLTERVSALTVGNGMDAGVDIGPMNSPAQRDRIAGMVEEEKRRGDGTILTGGEVPEGAAYDRGNFFLPTLITDPGPDSVLLTEEVFGPVLPIITVSDLDEAIFQANETRYGLGASVWSMDLKIVARACEELQAGMIWVNQHLRVPPEVPFGGMKASGIGRENGYESPGAYMDTKTVLIKS